MAVDAPFGLRNAATMTPISSTSLKMISMGAPRHAFPAEKAGA